MEQILLDGLTVTVVITLDAYLAENPNIMLTEDGRPILTESGDFIEVET